MSVCVDFGKYRLRSDARQWTISEPRVTEAGEEKDTPFAFCTTLEGALERIANQKLRDSDSTSLAELGEILNAFRGELAVLIPTGRPRHG